MVAAFDGGDDPSDASRPVLRDLPEAQADRDVTVGTGDAIPFAIGLEGRPGVELPAVGLDDERPADEEVDLEVEDAGVQAEGEADLEQPQANDRLEA